MKKKEDPKFAAVEWFLGLISMDLSSISELDFSRLIVEAKHYFLKPMSSLPLPFHEDFSKPTWIGKKELTGNIKIPGLSDDYPWRETLEYIQVELKELIEARIRDPGRSITITKADVDFGNFGGIFRINYGFLDLIIGKLSDKEFLAQRSKIVFCYALDGVPADSVKRCLECGKLFLHLSRKERFYCSPQCTSRRLSRKRREEDREGYNAKQAEIMKKKYREKKAKMLGKAESKVKIQARKTPTKK